jgi:competence protein CoiA
MRFSLRLGSRPISRLGADWPLRRTQVKFAVVDGERQEAQPGLSGECPGCGNAMIAKCGPLRVRHWAHQGIRTCDHWWESETEWHRTWKNNFPKGWQEIIRTSEHGEKHIADVKTERGVVLEFQHSFVSREERESREAFYQNMVWVVDGRRTSSFKPTCPME